MHSKKFVVEFLIALALILVIRGIFISPLLSLRAIGIAMNSVGAVYEAQTEGETPELPEIRDAISSSLMDAHSYWINLTLVTDLLIWVLVAGAFYFFMKPKAQSGSSDV